MVGSVISVKNFSKNYKVLQKGEGFKASLTSLFNRKYRVVEAAKNISFDIEEGEIIGFLGPNGAGKTTTLKALSGLLHPTSGEVRVNGYTPFKRNHDFLRKITLVMGQKQQLLWDLSSLDSFKLNQTLYEIPEDKYRKNIGLMSDMLNIHDILDKPMRTLSLGERMKCELAAAMLHEPKVLFLDEPTIGLDINVQKRVREFIANYRQEFNATIMLTSHYMADVTALADRIIVIDKGQQIFEGKSRELVNKFSSQKLLKLHFEEVLSQDVLDQYGTATWIKRLEAELLVDRDKVSATASRILAELPIADISIEEIPFEDVLGQLFDNA